MIDGKKPRLQLVQQVSGGGSLAAKLGSQYAEQRPEFMNRGVGGDRVSDMYARWNEDAISLEPDLLSILIGVNDAWRIMNNLPTGATDRFERVYRHLLSETKEVLPDTVLVLCEPFILQTGVTVENWPEWKSKIDYYSEVVQMLCQEYGAAFVPLQTAFELRPEQMLHIGFGMAFIRCRRDIL